MTNVSRYWRPRSVDEALLLQTRPNSVFVSGGTRLREIHPGTQPLEVIDLQDAVRSSMRSVPDGFVTIGAGTTLQEIADEPRVPEVVRVAARRERPSTLRTWATIGSFVAQPNLDSELLAGLLAYLAEVEVVHEGGRRRQTLESLVTAEPVSEGEIVTELCIETSGRAAQARAARTTADRPIVAAVARSSAGRIRIVVVGLTRGPVVVDEVTVLAATLDEAGQPGGALDDFRGSAEYRRAVAGVLTQRLIAEVGQ